MKKAAFLALAALIGLSSIASGDEVDDVLALKARNRDKVQNFSAEFTVTTHQPKRLKNPKALKMRYKVKLEKLPKDKIKTSHNPWLMEAEVLEPLAMHMKVEGDQAWFKDQRGQWKELQLTPELREQFFGMSERFMGADPAEQKKHFGIKVLRHNNPVFGPKTKTVEYIPQGKVKMFSRMEEDVNPDGLPLETRIYDEQGKNTVKIKVKKHHKVKGVPVVDEMDAVSQTPAGEVTAETVSTGIVVETNETGGGR